MPAQTALRILIADDNVDAADSLTALLELEGHFVVTAYDGQQGLDAALSSPFDLAILDLAMPHLDGYGLGRFLRDLNPETTLVALSGHATAQHKARTRAEGFHHHLAKPGDPADLQAIISAVQRKVGHATASG